MPQTFLDSRYTRGEPLGSGGMAEVYLAHDEVLDRDVALKVLRDKYAKNEEFVGRFRREARSAASLNHPNIVSVYDRGRSEDGTYYIAMEHLPGGTLKDRVLADGPLDPNAAVEVGSQIARALGYAHEHGVIHRDIKPQNILLTGTGHAKVTDFGIARAASATTTTSRPGLVLGTAGYISPEQAMGRPVDPRSDLYSLGVVLYEMLTGNLPYSGENPVGVVLKHVDGPPRSPREANPDVPEPLDALTAKLLAKDPEDRHPSAVELADDLERVRSGLSPLVGGTEKTTAMVTAPLVPSKKKRPEKSAIRPPAALPMKVLEGGRRRRGRLFRTLAMVLLGVVLFAGLAWALARDRSSPETPGSEGASSGEEATPPGVQLPTSLPEAPNSDDTSGREGATPSTPQISSSLPETPGSEGASSGEEAAPPEAQGPTSVPEGSGSEDASSREETTPSTMHVPGLYYASEAEGALADAGLKLGNRTEVPDDAVPAVVVIEQDPAVGTPVEEGTAIDIVVSTGPKQAPVVEQAAPADVSASPRQAPGDQAVSATTQAVSASSVHDGTAQKKQKEKKKGKQKEKK